ncbi:hypothetical protein IFM89_033334 [Coptis chinensis]|uniref:Uncharacterized protein n=1 Tax=Coptis chinensis TaxID=261450 RepID=A0A835LPM5_9MAGN|nr:hypothetical protein IFM89_033334 [Coptis chinensis]
MPRPVATLKLERMGLVTKNEWVMCVKDKSFESRLKREKYYNPEGVAGPWSGGRGASSSGEFDGVGGRKAKSEIWIATNALPREL